jgi:hypothetical protein
MANKEQLSQTEQQAEERVADLESRTIDIAFQHDGKDYKGWATPSGKKGDNGMAASYHVVLNEVFFGNLSHNKEKWATDTQREEGLIQATGKALEKQYQ